MKIIIIILSIFLTSIIALFSQESIENLEVIIDTRNGFIGSDIASDESFSQFINKLEESQNTNFYIIFRNLDSNQISNYLSQIKVSFHDKIIGLGFDNCNINKFPEQGLKLFIKAISLSNMQNDFDFGNFRCFDYRFGLIIKDCNFTQLPKNLEKINSQIELAIIDSDTLTFDLDAELKKFNRKNNIFKLSIYVNDLNIFPETIFSLNQLQRLSIFSYKLKIIPDKFDNLINLRLIFLPGIKNKEIPSLIKLRKTQGTIISTNNMR